MDDTAIIDYVPDPYAPISIKMKVPPRDDTQRNAIGFLIGEGDFQYSKKYSQLLLNLEPGAGKTYIAVAGISFLRMRAIIITHMDRIRSQWLDTFNKATDLSEKEICYIDGSKDIDELLKNDNIKYKVFMINHNTILSYANKHGWDAITEFFKHIKVGIKIFDEAHLNFDNILKIDLNTNTKKTFYLTATFNRSDYNEDKLFSKCFNNVIRYGENEHSRKHIIYVAIEYNSKPTVADELSVVNFKGFNKISYANYLKGCQTFYDSLDYAVKYFAEKAEGKMLILSSKIDLCDDIKAFIENALPEKTVSVYHSKISAEDKIKALTCDIICTTPKSAGTGVDIPGLRTVIMTEAYSSKVQAEQISGRLREYSPTAYTFYVELVDIGFSKVYDMYRRRQPVLKKKCVKMLKIQR